MLAATRSISTRRSAGLAERVELDGVAMGIVPEEAPGAGCAYPRQRRAQLKTAPTEVLATPISHPVSCDVSAAGLACTKV